MQKIIKNGKVAVAVSYDYGAGWSTWNNVNPMDARFNALFLEDRHDEAAALCEGLDLGFAGGAKDVHIEWVPVGTEFIIDEYDGSECLQKRDSVHWHKA